MKKKIFSHYWQMLKNNKKIIIGVMIINLTVFVFLNFNSSDENINSTTSNKVNSSQKAINDKVLEEKTRIVEEMMKNHTGDVLEIRDEEEILKEKELEEANDKFNELYNSSFNLSESSENSDNLS